VIAKIYALLPWRTAQGNVESGLEAKGVPRRERRHWRGNASGWWAFTTGTRTSCPGA
jgi:ABC-type proline/glycine betaine transport system ATPase subunit